MKTLNKTIRITLLAFFVIGIFSCANDEDSNEWTEADELAELNSYILALEADGLNVDTTELGVYYVMVEEGTGETPIEGDSISMKYTGFLLDGSAFDSSIRSDTDTTYNFRYKIDRMIPGFEDGLAIMNEGAIIQMIIPSKLGYGPNGSYPAIPSYSSLIFVVELVGIIPD